MHFVLFTVIGLITGVLARHVVSEHDYGAAGDIAVAVPGAFLSGWVCATLLGVGGGGFFVSLFVAFLGAIAPLWLIRLIAPDRA
jgi:uncharacterized membrane protein YeaQ/YmgE (transglycosylase-associated protein family)